jgi:hypothetical protein
LFEIIATTTLARPDYDSDAIDDNGETQELLATTSIVHTNAHGGAAGQFESAQRTADIILP